VTSSNELLSFETERSRQILGRVPRGRGLQDALGKLVDEHRLRTAWLSAMGAFEWVELTEYNQAERRYESAHRFESCEILSLQGNLSELDGAPFWHMHATISLRENGRDVTYGGHVVDGSVFALEFRIDCFDELLLQRAHDEATGLRLWSEVSAPTFEVGVASPMEPPSEGVSWAIAAALSARAEPVVALEYKPAQGDWIEHAQFGLCKIEGLSGDGVCFIKLADSRRKKIKIDAMQVSAPRIDDGRRIFPVRAKPKR